MACIKKINKDYAWNCESPNDTLGGISEAILINSSDISLMTINQGNASIQLVAGTKGFVVESANNGINVAFAVKANAVTSAGLDAVVTMTMPNETLNSNDDLSGNALLSAEVAIAFKAATGYYIVGLGEPLSVTEIAADTAANGSVIVTWGLQEYQLGTLKASLTASEYVKLKTSA